MKKYNKSLVNHVLINNFSIIIAAVMVVFVSLFASMCAFYRSDRIAEARTGLAQSVAALRFSIEERIQQSDFMVKNTEMMSKLDFEFSDNYELVKFMNEFSLFLSSLDESESTGIYNFTIYTDNPTLVNSGHIYASSKLEGFDKKCINARRDMQYFFWNDAIRTNENDYRYITLYRYIPGKYNCIAEMKIFIDPVIPDENIYNIELLKTSEYRDDIPFTFSEEIPGGFTMISRISSDMLNRQYALYFVTLMTVGIAFLVITYVLASRSVNRTMKDILMLIEEIESGDIIDSSATPDRWKEVNIIKNKIGDMTKRLNDITSREYEQELLRRKLEIEVLNSKINPHLLYNSLSAIKLVAFKENTPKVSAMTDVLIDYYRLVLNKGEDTISVVSELEYLEKYIEIHEISKKIPYDVEYDICREAFDIRIPHMLLQPIIENAILHGLNTSTDAKIKISVHTAGDFMKIDIRDNGVGIEAEKLEELNSRRTMGYGLKSVIQRADFYYAGNFDFSVSSQPGMGTTVSLKIPRQMSMSI